MFRQPDSNPFRRNWFHRILGGLIGRFFLVIDSTLALFKWVNDNTILRLHKSVMGRIFGQVEKWQVSKEEQRNRGARVQWYSRFAGKFNFLVFRVGRDVQKSSLFQRVWKPIRSFARFPAKLAFMFGQYFEVFEKWLAKSVWFRWLYFAMSFTRTAFAGTYEFTRKWGFSRNYFTLVGGIPAVLLLVPLLIVLARAPFQSQAGIANRYRVAAREAFEERDHESVQLYYRKIQQIGVLFETAMFESALANASKGNVEQAFNDMQRLADEHQFVPAKLWVAKSLLENQRSELDRVELQETILRHINDVLSLDSRNVTARVLMADYYRSQNQLELALKELRAIARDFPPAQVMISQIEWQRGDVRKAKSTMSEVLAFYAKRNDDGLTLDSAEYLSWATASSILGDTDQLFSILKLGQQAHPENADYCRSAADLLVRVFDQGRKHISVARQDAVLRAALALSPDDKAILERYVAVDSQLSRDYFVKRLKAKHELPVNVLAAMGVTAYRSGDFVAAKAHFEAAQRMKPDSPSIANNLAWLAANSGSIDLEAAIKLADRAVDLAPNNPGYRETRGQILVKKGRWTDGIKDLELALNGSTNEQSAIHLSLAEAYEKIGQTDLASVHRKRANFDTERN